MVWLRTSRPESGNPYYNTKSNGGYSTCIVGQPTVSGLNVLCNCVGLADGAFNETYVKNTPGAVAREHYALNCEANLFITRAKALGLTTKAASDIPPVGGIIVWGGTANHVAYISEVKDNNTIVIHQSGWDTPSWEWDIRTVTRNQNGSNLWAYRGTCLGFIVNPAIGDTPTPTPSPEDYPANIHNVTRTNKTTVKITGELGGITNITTDNILYYKWNTNTVSSTNYDGYVYASSGSISNRIYTVNINKPYEAGSIAVIPYQINTGYDRYPGRVFTTNLTSSIPCINVIFKGISVQSIPYVFYKGQWKRAVPLIYTNNKWNTIYNDKK